MQDIPKFGDILLFNIRRLLSDFVVFFPYKDIEGNGRYEK